MAFRVTDFTTANQFRLPKEKKKGKGDEFICNRNKVLINN
jgi:hypothetical protein